MELKPDLMRRKEMKMKTFSFKFCSIFLRLVVLSALVTLHASEAATTPTYLSDDCKNSTTITPNSTYASNRNALLSKLSSNPSGDNDFYYATAGGELTNNLVFGLFLCRGDVTSPICQDCVVNASKEIQRRCPDGKEAVIWYEECLLRYSSQPIFAILDTTEGKYLPGLRNDSNSTVTDNDQFELLLGSMVNTLAIDAANAHKQSKKFAASKQNFTGSETVYGLAQCTPDLSVADCSKCFRSAIAAISTCCNGQRSARLLLPSCYIMYDSELFFNESAFQSPPPPLPPPPPPPGKTQKLLIVIVATAVPVVVTALLVVMGCLFIRRRARKKYNALITRESAANDLTRMESLQFDFKSIENATDKFADYNMLGKGGFGEVYKGTLPNGREIAVKRLSKSSGQGPSEFKNEVVLVAKLQHRNLVRLLGFCLDGDERILVYEYVPNKSLDYFLFDSEKQGQLNWPTRCNIIEGIARGVLYLHEDSRLKIIHRDLKASNILLDKKMNPKVSDFGMAKMFGVDQTQGNTRRIVGTYGYMAPEYAMGGLYSIKSDVFSFGVLLLEILSGRRNTSFHITDCAISLVAYAWQLWNEGKALDLVVSCLKDSCHDPNKFLRYIQIGLLCVQEDAILRPTMSSVVLMLKSEALSLSQPERPAFIANRHTSHQEIIALSSSSVNGMTVSDFLPR